MSIVAAAGAPVALQLLISGYSREPGRARPRRRHRRALPQSSAPAGRGSSAALGRWGRIRAAALGGSRALRGPRRRLASSRRLRAPAGRAGLPGHDDRSVGGRERYDSARQAARDPRTLAGTTPVQPAPGRQRGRSRTTSTRPGPRTSRGRCAACSCTIRGRSRRRASRRPAGRCQRFRSAASYRKRQAAMKAAKKET